MFMSWRKNNRIKINELLRQAKVESLKKYFNNIENEVLVYDLFKQLVAKLEQLEPVEKSSISALSVFILVNYSWETYGNAKDNLKLSTDEVYWMFVALEQAVKFCNPKGLEAQSVFALVLNIWENQKSSRDNYRLTTNVIFEMFLMLYYAFWALEKSDNKGLKELSAKAVFNLVKEVWDTRKNEKDDLKISSVETSLVFQTLAEAIGKCDPAELKSQEVFELAEEIWEARKNVKGDLELRRFEINEMFQTLACATEKCNTEELEASVVFNLVKDVWNNRKKTEVFFELEEKEINKMFKVLACTIKNGNSQGLKELSAKVVFDLVQEVFNQVNYISADTTYFMLDTLFLISKIDERSENNIQSQLQSIGLDIGNDYIILKDKDKLKDFSNERCTKLIVQIIEEQKLGQKANKEESKKRQEQIEKIEKKTEKKKEKPQNEIEKLRKKSEHGKNENEEKVAKMEQEGNEKKEHKKGNEKERKKEEEHNSTSKLEHAEAEDDFFGLWDSNRLNNNPYYLSIVNKETWQNERERKEREERKKIEKENEKQKNHNLNPANINNETNLDTKNIKISEYKEEEQKQKEKVDNNNNTKNNNNQINNNGNNIQTNNLINKKPQNDNIVVISDMVKNSGSFAAFCDKLTMLYKDIDLNKLNFGPAKLRFGNCFKAFFSILLDRLKALFGIKGIDVNCDVLQLAYLKVVYENIKSGGTLYRFEVPKELCDGINDSNPQNNMQVIQLLSKLIKQAKKNPNVVVDNKNQIE